jgi:surface antigen
MLLAAGCETMETAADSVRTTAGKVGSHLENMFDMSDDELYAEMTEDDLDLAGKTFQEAMEGVNDEGALTWSNPESGNSGFFRPVRTYVTSGGYFCRDYEETLNVNAEQGTYQNMACREVDGGWIWVN